MVVTGVLPRQQLHAQSAAAAGPGQSTESSALTSWPTAVQTSRMQIYIELQTEVSPNRVVGLCYSTINLHHTHMQLAACSSQPQAAPSSNHRDNPVGTNLVSR
jgi:hypothetical protein